MTPQFEEWAKSLNINLAKKAGGDGYAFTAAVYAWKAWQAAYERGYRDGWKERAA